MEIASPNLEKEVITLVSEETGTRPELIRPHMTIFGDLGIDADDGMDLLHHFEQKFCVDMTACRPNRHFGPDGFVPWAPFHWIIHGWRSLIEKNSSPESRARLVPIRVQDLIDSAKSGKWIIQYVDDATH